VIEDICMLDQLSGGRVEYGIAAIEHFWFEGDWFASHERFDEALAIVLQGLRTGTVGGAAGPRRCGTPAIPSLRGATAWASCDPVPSRRTRTTCTWSRGTSTRTTPSAPTAPSHAHESAPRC
jgi:alkanesulfonate monooxygenase SsuD/methylene tetrahydromethanopterin reductase-like flavin-dependent oxidoreductase (luciferase family)